MAKRLTRDETSNRSWSADTQSVPHAAASRGLAAAFGLDLRAALLTIIVDVMVFGLDSVSLETLLPLGILIASVLGFIV